MSAAPDAQEPEEEAPDYTPRANPIVDASATVAACAADYKAGEDVRDTLAQQDAQHR